MTSADSEEFQDLDEIARQAEAQETVREAAAGGGDTEALRAALEQKAKEAAEAKEQYVRTAADFDNYRKRMQRDLAEFRKYANEQMALDLLAVADHLDLAIRHAREAGEANQGLLQGVELVFKQLRDTLEKFGVKQFPAAGEPFDPKKHDALMQVESADAPENTVVQVLQEGYLYHDKVLRHAKVGVAKRPAAQPEQQDLADQPDPPDENN